MYQVSQYQVLLKSVTEVPLYLLQTPNAYSKIFEVN